MSMTNNDQVQDSTKARRTEYNTISEDTRKAIIKHWEDNHCSMSFKSMAQNMNVRASTFKSIVKLYRETGRIEKKQRGGKSRSLINEEHLQFIKDCVNETPDVTLGKIQDEIKDHFNLERPHSIFGIDYALKNRIQYALKQIRKYPEIRNDYEIRIQRRNYCNMLAAHDINYNTDCIFINEIVFNLWLTKGYPRSDKGLPAFQTVSSQKKRTISVMAAMSVNGVLFSAVSNTTHGTNEEDFASYLTGLFNYLEVIKAPDQTLILDNCRIQTSSEVEQVMKQFSRHKIIFLPPWSSFLNPIEKLFSKMNYFVKREHLNDTETLLQTIKEGLAEIPANDCADWISCTQVFFPRCLGMEEIL